MKKIFILMLALLSLSLLLVACTTGTGNTETTAPEVTVTPEPTTDPEGTADITEPETTPEPDVTEPSTETSEPETTVTYESVVVDFNDITEKKFRNIVSGTHLLESSLESDEDGEQYLKLTAQEPGSDPFVSFDLSKYLRQTGADRINAADFPYIIMKVRSEGMSNGNFDLFYITGRQQGVDGSRVVNAAYDVAAEGWQYLLFDLSKASGWDDYVNSFRLDIATELATAGEALCIAEITFCESDQGYYESLNIDWDNIGIAIDPDALSQAEELLASVEMPKTSYDSYTPETADKESSSLHVWFDHMFDRTAQNDNSSTELHSYQLKLAANEIEGCQMILASDADVSGLKVAVTDFINDAGDTLESELLWGYYFTVDGQNVIDPLVPVTYTRPDQFMVDWLNGNNSTKKVYKDLQKYDGFDIKAGENQTFIIKAKAPIGAPAGEYTATVTVTDSEGNEVKRVTLFAYVWDFELPEETSCKTLMDCGSYGFYLSYSDFAGVLTNEQGHGMARMCYDFLLENRVCAYSLPFENTDGSFSAEGIMDYLNNPRVVAFQTLGWKVDPNATNLTNAYNVLSQNQKWLDKAYFYPVDEPMTMDMLNSIKGYADLFKEYFPDYNLLTPIHVNYNIVTGDYFSYMKDTINTWCLHHYLFNSYAEWSANRNLTYFGSALTESRLGTVRDRIKAEQAAGDEVWWYVTSGSRDNVELALNINSEAVNYRTLFWQQKLYGVDGFLYYCVGDWNGSSPDIPQEEFMYGLDAKHEIHNDGRESYGSGVLLYSGVYFAQVEPIGSLRLECVRDGIEDYEYLTILENEYGTEVVNAIISKWTTSLWSYSTDEEAFEALCDKLALLIEQID